MVIYDHDSNAMLAKTLKSRAAAQHLASIQEVHQYLNRRVIHPKMRSMRNECSPLVKECIKNEKIIELTFVPPYLHRVNASGKEIGIFKCQFVTSLAIVDSQFHLHL